MRLKRTYDTLESFMKQKKCTIILGARRIGKTDLITQYINRQNHKTNFLTGDKALTRELFESQDFDKILALKNECELLVIDEAQKLPKIGEALKILVDYGKEVDIIATGSSSFELKGQVGEPLTGRKVTLEMFPVAFGELVNNFGVQEVQDKIEQYMLYGTYPEVLMLASNNAKEQYLLDLVNSYLLKDVLDLEKVKNTNVLLNLLRYLSYAIGSEVSLSEIGAKIGADYKTVARYIYYLEEAYVIKTLHPLKRNLIKEISSKKKYYFVDLGVRNGVIQNFAPLDVRPDKGAIFENFAFIERLKQRVYSQNSANLYFWRNFDGKEIDLIEDKNGILSAVEFKYSKNTGNANAFAEFKKGYQNSTTQVVTKETLIDFVLKT